MQRSVSGSRSRLDSVQRAMPALAEATKLGAKAQKAGFDWPDWRDLLPKLAEETAELEAEAASDDPARKPAVEAELGDLLFTVVNLGRHLGVDAEMALRGCNRRFRRAVSRDGTGCDAAAGRAFAGRAGGALGRGEDGSWRTDCAESGRLERRHDPDSQLQGLG